MSDRKYRQRGYQDENRERESRGPRPPRPPQQRAPGRQLQDAAGPKTPNLMAAHEVFRCARCGNLLSLPVGSIEKCSRCGVDLHSCIQCGSFDTSARWECTQSAQLAARIAPKDGANDCAFFTARTTVERQTSTPPSAAAGPGASAPSSSARKAFDDLFK